MKMLPIILLLSSTSWHISKAMNALGNESALIPSSSREIKYCEPEYPPADENLNKHLMDHQKWKELTRQAIKQYPENEDVKKLQRYLIIISKMVRKKLPQDNSITLVEFVKKDRDVMMFGAREEAYIETGKVSNCPYPMYGIDEQIWVNQHLAQHEERIASFIREKQKLPGHGCLQ